MPLLRIGIEKEFARAMRKERVLCLVAVVALDRGSLAPLPKHLHIVIAVRSYQIRPLDFSGKLKSK